MNYIEGQGSGCFNSENKEKLKTTLNKLIIVRHGDYQENSGQLTDQGIKQVTDLADKIRRIQEREKLRVAIITSTTTRAIESSKIIASVVGADVMEERALHYLPISSTETEDFLNILSLIDSKNGIANMLIAVTHLEFCNKFPQFYGKQRLNQDWPREDGIGKGHGVIIDLKAKTKALI